MTKMPNRIPFESAGAVTSWMAPSVGGKAVPSAQRQAQMEAAAAAKPPKQPHEVIENLSDEPAHTGHLTAAELQDIAEQAHKEGFNAGFDEGLAKGEAEGHKRGYEAGRSAAYGEFSGQLQGQIAELRQLCEQLMEPLAAQETRLENQLLNLAVALAEQLLGQSLRQDPGQYWALLQRGLDQLPTGARVLRLHLPPEHCQSLREALGERGQDWALVPDSQLSPGAYRLDADPAQVSFCPRTALAQWLADAANHQPPESPPALTDYSPPEPPEPPELAEPPAAATPAEALVATPPGNSLGLDAQPELTEVAAQALDPIAPALTPEPALTKNRSPEPEAASHSTQTEPAQTEPAQDTSPSADPDPEALGLRPLAGQEPSAHKEPSAEEKPTAHQAPSATNQPPAHEDP